MTFGGLIGYSIRPSQRGKGYASEMLKLALEKFANTSIDNILITCKDFNLASKKVIEKMVVFLKILILIKMMDILI